MHVDFSQPYPINRIVRTIVLLRTHFASDGFTRSPNVTAMRSTQGCLIFSVPSAADRNAADWSEAGQMWPYSCQHLIVKQSIGRQYAGLSQGKWIPVAGRDLAPGFFNKQLPCRKVPRRQLVFKVGSVKPAGDVSQVQRGCSEASHAMNLSAKAIADRRKSRLHHRAAVVIETDSDQSLTHGCLSTDLNGFAVVA